MALPSPLLRVRATVDRAAIRARRGDKQGAIALLSAITPEDSGEVKVLVGIAKAYSLILRASQAPQALRGTLTTELAAVLGNEKEGSVATWRDSWVREHRVQVSGGALQSSSQPA